MDWILIKIRKFEIMLKYCIIVVLLVSGLSLTAQDDAYVQGDEPAETEAIGTPEQRGFDWKRVTIGGGFGMTFGDLTFIEIAPTFGYYLTDNILAGVGGSYTYYSDNRGGSNWSTSIYGGRIFGQYLFDNLPLLAHTELELINFDDLVDGRVNIVNLYVGGGIQQRFSNNSFFYILALWNLNETKESLYFQPPSPIIRGGIAIGL